MIVDVDDPDTWPPQVATLIQERLDAVKGRDGCPADLIVEEGHAFDDTLREYLTGHLLRAYHCTRLLDHEAADVRDHGLRLLDEQLVADRLQAVHQRGLITTTQRDLLMAQSRISEHAAGTQVLNQICLVPSTEVFHTDVDGVERLLATWGGEVIYWAHADVDSAVRDVLRQLGQPTIVRVQLDIPHIAQIWPCLIGPFLATKVGWTDERGASICYNAPIPSTQIEELWQPGDTPYDRFPELPR